MRNIYVKVYSPYNVGIEDPEEYTLKNIKKYCIKVFKCESESHALWTYANTMCDWSTILDSEDNIQEFVDKVAQALLEQDIDWLEINCV